MLVSGPETTPENSESVRINLFHKGMTYFSLDVETRAQTVGKVWSVGNDYYVREIEILILIISFFVFLFSLL